MHDPTLPAFLIMNNCLSHNELGLLALYAPDNIRVIWLPAHSSHFRQRLDLGLFGGLTGRSQRSSRKLTRPQWQGKLLRINRTWHVSTYALNIWNSSAAAAIRPSTTAIPRWHVDAAKIEDKIAE
jgi:hypothetical protein